MKKKILLGLMLASVASANSFAMEIMHGKLISHKEWTKGNIKASFKDIQIKPASLTALKLKDAVGVDTDVVSANSYTFPYVANNVVVNQDVTIWGESNVYIINNSSVQKTYVITTYLEIAPPCTNVICAIELTAASQDTVTLDPNGGLVGFKRQPYTHMNFSSAGKGWYHVATTVQVDGGTVFSSPSNEQEFTVSDVKK